MVGVVEVGVGILLVGYIVLAAAMIFQGRWLAVGTFPGGDGGPVDTGGCHGHMGGKGGGGHCH